VLAVALLAAWPSAAGAAGDATPNALVRKGAELFKNEDYEGARTAFARAYAVDPKASTLFNLALSELHADHPVEATKHLREYLMHSEEPADKRELVRTKWLPRAEAHTTTLSVFAPPGADVAVDGIAQAHVAPGATTAGPAGAAPTTLVIAEGEHDVSAKQGATAESQHVVAHGGEALEVHFQRLPDAAQAFPTPTGGEPDPREAVEGGVSPRAKWATVIALGSGAALAAGVGVGFAIATQNKAANVHSLQSEIAPSGLTGTQCAEPSAPAASCAQLKNDLDANRRDWAISTAAFLGAGVLAGASAAAWTLWRTRPPSAAALRLQPMVATHGSGLSIGGGW
jgi:hypothetical protein